MKKNKQTRIAVFDAKPYDIEFLDRENRKKEFSIKYFEPRLNSDTVALSQGYDVVCAFVNDRIDAPVVEALVRNGVRLVALRCAGYNNVDLKAVFGKLPVVRVPAYSPNAVAEHAVALIMTLNRKIHKAYNRVRDSNFRISGLLGFDMAGKTGGIVGTGNIGRILAQILRGFGMKVLLYDPKPDPTFAAKIGCRYTKLETLYRECDILSLHCPLNENTRYMINAESIRTMKRGVMIINTGRGLLINTRDLIAALKSGHIGSAGLDVYEEESEYFFEDRSDSVLDDDILARLTTFPNVIVTSHQGFFTHEALTAIASTTLQNVRDFTSGKMLRNEICYRCGTSPCPKKAKHLKSCALPPAS